MPTSTIPSVSSMVGPENPHSEDIPLPLQLESHLQAALAQLEVQPGVETTHFRCVGLSYGLPAGMLALRAGLLQVEEAEPKPELTFDVDTHPGQVLNVFGEERPGPGLVELFRPLVWQAGQALRAQRRELDAKWLASAWRIVHVDDLQKLGATTIRGLLDSLPPGVLVIEYDQKRLSQSYANGAYVSADWLDNPNANLLSLQEGPYGDVDIRVGIRRPDGRQFEYTRLDTGIEMMETTPEDPASPYAQIGEPRVLEEAWQMVEALVEAFRAGPSPSK